MRGEFNFQIDFHGKRKYFREHIGGNKFAWGQRFSQARPLAWRKIALKNQMVLENFVLGKKFLAAFFDLDYTQCINFHPKKE